MDDTFYYRPTSISPKKLNIIKYQLYGTYQPQMVLRWQFHWLHAAKSNTIDQEQVTINQTKAC